MHIQYRLNSSDAQRFDNMLIANYFNGNLFANNVADVKAGFAYGQVKQSESGIYIHNFILFALEYADE